MLHESRSAVSRSKRTAPGILIPKLYHPNEFSALRSISCYSPRKRTLVPRVAMSALCRASCTPAHTRGQQMTAAALLADQAAYTIDEFCMAHRISRRTFYDLIERDQRRGG